MSTLLPNVTLDDTSPAILYIGNWDGDIHKGDPLVTQYSNTTFHASTLVGDTAVLHWNGGSIWVFGAFRANHGYFSISLDASEKQYINGQKEPDVFQQVMYSSGDLDSGDHTLILINEGDHDNVDETLTWVDLDYIVVQADSEQFDASKIADKAKNMITTGVPRVQAFMPPTGIPKPITISGAPCGLNISMGLEGIFGLCQSAANLKRHS
ncbi:uncharacterized protein L201_000509 [Kwoniella dendrophila CBS 6074]|uniref:Uncharacterized protein n=1 Tax=Kwoniella dendrophila CBS 6074 TaxID=1295534 RepID=A0AAX4JLD7_9TREE